MYADGGVEMAWHTLYLCTRHRIFYDFCKCLYLYPPLGFSFQFASSLFIFYLGCGCGRKLKVVALNKTLKVTIILTRRLHR